ncbi:restriction endonuclease subunit S [Pseudomonas nitroreducens]|uniref:restriction endonuclease subunit S n=1 Tax=Pseudomonas nitroreducens TaxID=46680 RepID=UPI001474D841|nr:restriction endonuclease subunit S [Pseudomonas nitroreducens]MDG9857083.1 restriction endonuclease subunit S [Pseudomonas nitroreducens]MDH1072485.1 restriction endonuclease subunit S [Pseudomonas nitroreducens]NMZ72066.1 restriction endonuclease subunit S [Pseudomonas nitroreducens]
MTLPSYPVYKDSGVEWLEEVPEHWAIFSLKRSVDGCTNGLWGEEPDGANDIAVIRVADFDRSTSRVGLDKLTYRSITQKERASRLLQSGDLLIEKSGGGEKTLVGCVVLFEHTFQAITSNFVARMRPLRAFDSGFLCYAFDSLYQGKVNYPAIKQTTGIQNLDSESYLQERFCFPPLAEQTQIARFLNHETARIDALIEEQQRLIELLKEKRQAVISHAVTKGLDPTVPMKDSGVEWLGEVPAHWDVVALKRIVEVKDGTHATPSYVDPSPDAFPLITSKDFIGTNIDFDNCKYISSEDHSEVMRRSDTQNGDVLMSMIGGNIGKALIVETSREFSIKNVALFKSAGSSKKAKQILYFLESRLFEQQTELISRGGAQGFLGLGDIRSLVIPKPPEGELSEILRFLAVQVPKLDSLIEVAGEAIRFMNERRSALISAAVTGKIDVRGWQPPAHTQAPESAVAEAN